MDDRAKALYCFFQTMDETAIDIYWGNNPFFERDDLKNLSQEDFDNAFKNACAELACDSMDQNWYNAIFSKLADYYGKHLKAAYIKAELENEAKEKVKCRKFKRIKFK